MDRYTDTGKKDGSGNAIVRWEQGTLFAKEGFIPITSSEFGADTFDLDSATLSAISGKTVGELSLWVQLHNIPGADYSAFARSAETYSIKGVPYVIVSVGDGPAAIEGKPTITLSAAQPAASEEGLAAGRFLIALDAARTQDVNVRYTVSGKAKNGRDYVRIANSVLIPAGNVSAYLDIVPVDDAEKEKTEKVTVRLKGNKAYKLAKARKAAVEIADND